MGADADLEDRAARATVCSSISAAATPAEWLPESETTFFVPGEAAGGDSSRIIFVKDAGGRVTHYIYRELGATDRIVKKVK